MCAAVTLLVEGKIAAAEADDNACPRPHIHVGMRARTSQAQSSAPSDDDATSSCDAWSRSSWGLKTS